MLKINNLKKHFGRVKAVDGCDFAIKENLITALIGPNGAGKSTVFNLISGLLKADGGAITFENKNIINLSPEKISNLGISRLFQQTRLFKNLTVLDNLLLAVDSDDTKFWKNLIGRDAIYRVSKDSKDAINGVSTKSVDNILELIGMTKFKNKLARDLSYGQKRLVEIGRAILNPHTFLMLDEPVAGVNPKLRQKISKILLALKKQGETILLIEHDMNFTFGLADWVIVMDEGKVIAQGKPAEIKNNSKVLEAYLGE